VNELTIAEVARLAGLSYQAVAGLIKEGVIAPLCRGSRGRGNRALFTRAHAVEIAVAAELRRSGLRWEAALVAAKSTPGRPAIVSSLVIEDARRRVLERAAAIT
jgi:DNA-binding transcriptional MerR regulator